MAAVDELKVKVSADVAGAVNGLKQFEAELGKTSKESTASAKAMAILTAQMERLKKIASGDLSFKQLERVNGLIGKTQGEMNRLNKTFGDVGPAVAKSGKDFTNLGRVIQDLPFGMQGIQNNLTQLIPAAGGLGLAFTGIVTALTFAQIGFGAWTRGLKLGKDHTDENAEALIRMGQELDAVKDKLEGFGDTLQFINRVGKLRLDINFGKGLGTDLIDLQAQSIGTRELIENLKDLRDQTLKTQAASLDILLPKFSPEEFDAFQKGILDPEKLDEDTKKALDVYNNAGKKIQEINSDLTKANQETGVLYAQIEQQKLDIIEEGNKKQDEARKKALAELKKRLEEEAKLRFEYLKTLTRDFVGRDKPITLFYQLQLVDQELKNNPGETLSQKLTKSFLPKTIPVRVNIAPDLQIPQPDVLKENLENALNDTIQRVSVEGFSALGEGIAAAISGGDLDGVFSNLFEFIGSALQDLGKQMIALAPIITALKAAIKTLNPALMLPAGIALVAIGGALRNLKPKGFATGGVIPPGFPNDSYYARLTSGERVLTPSQNKEWEGRNLGRAAMPSMPAYLPVHRLSGSDLLMWYERANKRGGLTS
jgi:hypothetical protein